MAYGLKITNTNNQIIVSENFATPHFVGKAQRITDSIMTNTGIAAYSSTGLNGVHVDTYVIHIPGSTYWNGVAMVANTAPIAFIRPAAAYYNWFYAIVTQTFSSVTPGMWTIVVMSSSPSKIYATVAFEKPSVYCFTSPDYATIANDSYGLVVKNAEGKTTFDSRGMPLAVADTIFAKHPAYVNNTGYYYYYEGVNTWDTRYTLYGDLATTSRYTSLNTLASSGIVDTNKMFAFTSVAQHVFRWRITSWKNSCGLISCQRHDSTAIWWTLSRGVVSVNGTSVKYGWGLFATGYSYSFYAEDGGWGGGGGGSYTSGTMPFVPKMINNTQDSICIIADASLYD